MRNSPRRPGLPLLLSIAACAAALAACERSKPAPPEPPPASPVIAVPAPPKPLDRGQVIAAARKAAEAYAVAAPYPAELGQMVGARFELRQPFGCEGENPAAPVGYSIQPKRQALVLRARPEDWTETPWVRALVGPTEVEAIEGVWIRRPWIATDACPALRAEAPPAEAAPETLGLARLFPPGASRVLRHGGRGYEVVRKAEPGVLRLNGFRLVLAGRVADFGGRQPIRCRSDGPDQRPVCLLAVEFDRVSFEDPVSGEVLAEWRS